MGRITASRPSPAILVAVLALVAALAGTAVAGPDASTSAVSKKKVKKIATKQINELAPGLSVASAQTANSASNANSLGGQPPSAFLPANTVGVPVAGASVAANGTLRASFNRFGGTPTVSHTPGSGFYILNFPGLEGRVCDVGSVALVSLASGNDGLINRGCSPGGTTGDPTVRTRNPADVATDRAFDMVVFVPGP